MQGSITYYDGFYIFTSKSYVDIQIENECFGAFIRDINITESDNSTYFYDEEEDIYEFYYLSEKHDKVLMRKKYHYEGIYDMYVASKFNGNFCIYNELYIL